MLELQMQAANGASGRSRVVVLDERLGNPAGEILRRVIRLEKEPAAILEHVRLDDDDIRKGRRDELHPQAPCSTSRRRYSPYALDAIGFASLSTSSAVM